MSQFRLFSLLSCFLVISAASKSQHTDDDSCFAYPLSMPDPVDTTLSLISTIIRIAGLFETPIVARVTSIIESQFWNCIATYHGTFLDSLTHQRPVVSHAIPDVYRTTSSRALCNAYATAIVGKYLFPDFSDSFGGIVSAWDLNIAYATLDEDVMACNGQENCLTAIAAENGFCPHIMASIVADGVIRYAENDGWNALGLIGDDGVECSANCRPYSDMTGYEPVVEKKTPDYFAGRQKNYPWQPLLEDNGLGFFTRAQHVVPHIGYTGKPRVWTREKIDSLSVPNPKYDYTLAAMDVVDRLAAIANNDTAKMLIELYDHKLQLFLATVHAYFSVYGSTTSYEQLHLLSLGYTVVEYDAIIVSWLQKLEWDLVRPTTVIQSMGGGYCPLTTWAGPGRGLSTILSKDWQPYIRTMPHSEYPSASGCLCTAITEFLSAYVHVKSGGASDSYPVTHFFPKGSSLIEPGTVPAEDITVTLPDLAAVRNVCGETRLLGGMHFTQSVPASYELCEGLGTDTFAFVMSLLNGENIF